MNASCLAACWLFERGRGLFSPPPIAVCVFRTTRSPLLMDRRATSALSEARQAQVNTNRQLKRQRAELEASKQALKAQLANVEKNLEAVHDRKRRSQRLAVFQPAHNEVFEIPMGADDVEGRLISDETKRALLRNARRAAEGKLEEVRGLPMRMIVNRVAACQLVLWCSCAAGAAASAGFDGGRSFLLEHLLRAARVDRLHRSAGSHGGTASAHQAGRISAREPRVIFQGESAQRSLAPHYPYLNPNPDLTQVRVPGGVQRRRSPRQSPRTKRLSLRISPSH